MASASAWQHSAGNRSSLGCEGGGEGALPAAALEAAVLTVHSLLYLLFFLILKKEMENNLALSRQRVCPAQTCTEQLPS